ncbi:hypothetical protein ONZ45_g16050 [Pleurotus djamor]|nr:hypothetical protein ONZ45_g16050 [Pleurotus djamor]
MLAASSNLSEVSQQASTAQGMQDRLCPGCKKSAVTEDGGLVVAFGEGETTVYRGVVDPDWCIGAVPNGGFVLALALQACIEYQAKSPHPDPIHLTAHYLRTTGVTAFDVRIRVLRKGKGFTNILADFMQSNELKFTIHAIFGVLNDAPTTPGHEGILAAMSPPSKYARHVPLHNHPATVKSIPMASRFGFSEHTTWTGEPQFQEKNKQMTAGSSIGGGGLEWGSWFELKDKNERITTSTLAFLVDMFTNVPMILSTIDDVGLPSSWFPTMMLAVEFKFPIPKTPDFASRTVGIYSSGTFFNNPSGHHDIYAEVWTAPSGIGEGTVEEGWRTKQRCLATATQMALTVPFEVNARKGQKASKL